MRYKQPTTTAFLFDVVHLIIQTCTPERDGDNDGVNGHAVTTTTAFRACLNKHPKGLVELREKKVPKQTGITAAQLESVCDVKNVTVAAEKSVGGVPPQRTENSGARFCESVDLVGVRGVFEGDRSSSAGRFVLTWTASPRCFDPSDSDQTSR